MGAPSHGLMLFTDVSCARLVRAPKKRAFQIVSQGKHVGMSDGVVHLTIPRHTRLNPYTVEPIIRSAGLTDEDLQGLI